MVLSSRILQNVKWPCYLQTPPRPISMSSLPPLSFVTLWNHETKAGFYSDQCDDCCIVIWLLNKKSLSSQLVVILGFFNSLWKPCGVVLVNPISWIVSWAECFVTPPMNADNPVSYQRDERNGAWKSLQCFVHTTTDNWASTHKKCHWYRHHEEMSLSTCAHLKHVWCQGEHSRSRWGRTETDGECTKGMVQTSSDDKNRSRGRLWTENTSGIRYLMEKMSGSFTVLMHVHLMTRGLSSDHTSSVVGNTRNPCIHVRMCVQMWHQQIIYDLCHKSAEPPLPLPPKNIQLIGFLCNCKL